MSVEEAIAFLSQYHTIALAIAISLDPDKASTLPMFHALTECDTVSFFGERGKKKRLREWRKCFLKWHQCYKSSKYHHKRSQGDAWLCLRGLLYLYMTVEAASQNVNETRQKLFLKRSRSLDSIPPTKASLELHVKRAVFQGGCIWGQTLLCQPVFPSPSD